LAPPPHRGARAVVPAKLPLFFLGFLVQLLLVVGLAIGIAPPATARGDPAPVWARLAGAPCLVDGPAGMPVEPAQDQRRGCQGTMSAAGLVDQALVVASASVTNRADWAVYASRTPLLSAG